MTTSRVLIAALLTTLLSIFAAPAQAQDYGPFGVFGSPNGGGFDEGDDIDVRFEAVGIECDSWSVLSDETGEAPSGGPGGSTFSFTVSPDEGTYSITAECNTSDTPQAAAPQAGVAEVQPASYVQGAGETQDTITFSVGSRDDDDDDSDDDSDDNGNGNGNGGKSGDLPNTGGENRELLLIGGALTLAGAAAVIFTRRRRGLL